jgi:drug/metabolite transporter (DMT)-like permease
MLYALMAMTCYGFTDFVYKRAAAATIRPDHFLMAQAWCYFPLVVLYVFSTGTLVPNRAAFWGFLAGSVSFMGFYYFMRSLSSGTVSTNASIFRLNFIVTVVLAIVFLGEPLTQTKLAGLGFALVSAWLLVGAGSSANDIGSRSRGRSLGQVGIATLAFGASNFFHTVGLRHGAVPETLAVAQALCFMPLATTVVYSRDGKLRPPPQAFIYGAPAALLLLGATIFLLRGVAGGQASVLVPIAQMGFMIAAILGIEVLGEQVTAFKVGGLASALAALAILAGS